MRTLQALEALQRAWRQRPHAITAGAFAMVCIFAGIAPWQILRNLRLTEPGLRRLKVISFALAISAVGIFGAGHLPNPWGIFACTAFCARSAGLSLYTDHHRFIVASDRNIVEDRWAVANLFAGFRWTRDEANRHFFFLGETGSDETLRYEPTFRLPALRVA